MLHFHYATQVAYFLYGYYNSIRKQKTTGSIPKMVEYATFLMKELHYVTQKTPQELSSPDSHISQALENAKFVAGELSLLRHQSMHIIL